MNRILERKRGAAALLVLALCLPPIAAGQADKTQSVTVVNPTTNPVNVKPVGTVPVTGSVVISGKPTVTVDNTVPVPVSGSVGITGSVPVTGSVAISGKPTVTIDNATEPVHFLFGCSTAQGFCEAVLPAVPAGKRLFVQYVAVRVQCGPVDGVSYAEVTLAMGPGPAAYWYYPVPVTRQRTDLLSGSQQMVAFTDEGSLVSVFLLANGASSGMQGTLTGYYVQR